VIARTSPPLRLSTFLLLVLAPVWAGSARAQAQTRPPRPDAAPHAPPIEQRAVEAGLIEAARANPDSFAAQHALGEFYLQTGKLPAAIPCLERARTIDPAHYANGYDLAVAYLETGRLDDARAQVRRMLQAKETGELHNLLGDVAERAGDRVAAAVGYQKGAHLDPTEDHLFDWGNNLLHLAAHADAGDVFTAAIRRHPMSARLHIGLGISQYSRGQHEDAVRSFCRAADLAPSDPRPYEFLGEMYGVSPDQAAEITRRLARFVELQPSSAAGHYYYAMNLWRGAAAGEPGADLARVETLLRTATTLDTAYTKPRLQLGILLSEQRRWREAIVELRAAVALDPEMAQGHFRLAQAYRRDGQPALADEELAIFEKLKGREPAAPVPD
jgi:tetratricopeptide (TPR) repeat protein